MKFENTTRLKQRSRKLSKSCAIVPDALTSHSFVTWTLPPCRATSCFWIDFNLILWWMNLFVQFAIIIVLERPAIVVWRGHGGGEFLPWWIRYDSTHTQSGRLCAKKSRWPRTQTCQLLIRQLSSINDSVVIHVKSIRKDQRDQRRKSRNYCMLEGLCWSRPSFPRLTLWVEMFSWNVEEKMRRDQ